MDCPRCSSSLTAYTLDERESLACEACGWVGIETTLHGEEPAGQPASWTEAMERGPERQATIDRSGVGLPPPVTADAPATTAPSDQSTTSERTAADAEQLAGQIEDLDPEAAEQLAAAGIESLGELASADPAVLACNTTLAASWLDAYSRTAAIQLVTAPDETPPAATDPTED